MRPIIPHPSFTQPGAPTQAAGQPGGNPFVNPPAPTNTGGPQPTSHGGWTYPDYNALLAQWMAPYQTQFDAQAQQGLTQLQTAEQVAQNRFNVGDTSTLSRLKNTHNDAVQTIVDQLAARGILHSGQNKFLNDREDLAYKTAKYDASNQLLDYLNGLQQQYASSQQTALDAFNTQRGTMAEQLAQIYQPYYTQPGSSPYIQNFTQGGGWGSGQ